MGGRSGQAGIEGPPLHAVPGNGAAGERLSIEVENQDDTAAEFESHDLRVEKVIAPRGRIIVTIGPLKPGTYKFVDEYHEKTAAGTLTAVARQ